MNYKGKTTIDISSYDKFKTVTKGNAYDIDGSYGYQCYDLGQIFWLNACSRYVTSKTADGGIKGGASGIWGDRSNNNKNSEFELVTDYSKIKRGDIIITNNGTYGHICFADADNTGQTYLPVFGQNQGNTGGAVPGAECKVINWNLKKYFLGAFRFKKWNAANDNSANTITYTVVKGDSLSKIGSKLGVNWKTIADLNNLTSPYIIYIGQKLKISSSNINTGSITTSTTLKVGDKVKIIAKGNAQASGKGSSAGGVGMTKYITKIHSGTAYPYQVGNKGSTKSKDTTGFYKISALKKI